jgi:hypothetical protein
MLAYFPYLFARGGRGWGEGEGSTCLSVEYKKSVTCQFVGMSRSTETVKLGELETFLFYE